MRLTERASVRANRARHGPVQKRLRSIFRPKGRIGEDAAAIDSRCRLAGLLRPRPSRSIAVLDGFSGEINGLNQSPEPVFDAFLLASGARILYPVVCFA
jgi:hypothetical protein